MLQKLKNELRLVKDKWLKISGVKRFWIVSILIALIISGVVISNGLYPKFEEETFSAMDDVVEKMISEKTTDVDFDELKIGKYTVEYKANGDKEIRICAVDFWNLEQTDLILSKDYKIQRLTKTSTFILVMLWIAFVLIMCIGGCILTAVLLGIKALIKKIVKFFKE